VGNGLRFLRNDHRRAFPILAPSMRLRTVDADVLIASSSGWAHGMRSTGAKVVYCHTPARWLYRSEQALQGSGRHYRTAVRLLGPPLRRWDARAARSATRYVVNSDETRRNVKLVYGVDAEIVSPPLTLSPAGPFEPVAGIERCDVLVVSRLRHQKNLGLVLDAAAGMPDVSFVIVGEGHLGDHLRAEATANVSLVGRTTDAELRWLYRQAGVLLAPAYEDFGLTPIEAAAHGTPTAALRAGGYVETVVDGRTGVYFEDVDVDQVRRAIEHCLARSWDEAQLHAQARHFSVERFQAEMIDLVGEVVASLALGGGRG
jgi:glycosyltransferase involved in cell wall biosynthesis